jgi:hypothetical protein
MPERQTVSSVFYAVVIVRLFKCISQMNPQFREQGNWFFMHDNVPSRSAMVVKIFLAKHGVVEISHLSYTPVLSPADFFLFPTEKTALK